jgi:tight adherence protein C
MASLMETVLFGLLALFSLGCVIGGLAMAKDQGKIDRRLRDIHSTEPSNRLEGWRPLAAMVNGLTVPGQDQEEIQRGLRAGGYYHPDALPIFGALRLGGGLLAAVATVVLLVVANKWAGPMRLLPIAAAGAMIVASKPMLSSLASRRSRKINAELPFTLDVLLMMLESGVSLDQCFRTFAMTEGRAAPMVRQTVVALVEDLQRGMAYDMALARWSDRLGVLGARELASVFRQALAHGSELSTSVRQFAIEFADMRVSTAREAIGKKTVRMTVIMMVFFMPALLLVLVGPAAVSLVAALAHLNR